MTNEVCPTILRKHWLDAWMLRYVENRVRSFSGPSGLKQTASIATIDFGAADHALAQIIHGLFIWTFGSGDFNFDVYTD